MIPTEATLLAACRDGTAVHLLSQILESVVTSSSHRNMDVEVETAARAIDVLTGTLESLQTRNPRDVTTTTTNTTADAALAFTNAFATAVWRLTCCNSSSNSSSSTTTSTTNTDLSANAVLVSVVKAVLDASVSTQLAEHLLQCVADCKFLQTVGILDSTTDLPRKLRIMNTTVNYRQYKFNLLAEESEGYSKFLYYLQQQQPPSSDHLSTDPSNAIHILIGTYSLDPNRCLDLAVDVVEYEYECVMQKHYENGDGLVDCFNSAAATLSPGNHPYDMSRLQFLWHCLHPLAVTGKLPQLLGFKLRGRRVLSSSNQKSVSSLLRCMTWLCLQQPPPPPHDGGGGKVTLLDASAMLLYLPDDNNNNDDSVDCAVLIDRLYTAKMRQEKERIQSVGRVRLTSTEDAKDENKSSAVSVDLQPLADLLVIQWMLVFLRWKAFDTIQHVFNTQQWSDLAVLFPTTVGTAILDGVQSKISLWLRSQTPWSVPDDSKDNSSMDVDEVKTTKNEEHTTVMEVLAAISTPLACTMESGCILLRPTLYGQLCRLLAFLLRGEKDQRTTEDGMESLVHFLRTFLVPSLSVFNPNPALSMELWAVLQQLPYRTRYSLYRTWRGSGLERASLQSNKPLWLIEGELLVGKDARYALKRLSKDTIRDMSRAVAKCCHSHPLVVFTTILNQIEAYDNLVQVMVDACRFVTPLSLDVLGFCILQRLSGSTGGVNRNRLKENGVNVSQWLQSLEAFTGAFYKRFPFIEFQGILCYLMQRLKDGHVMELGVLRTLLKSCGGWSFADYAPAASLSATQLDGRAGSTTLKRETMTFGVVSDVDLSASNEVRRVLQNDKIGVSLLILLAQVRHQIIFQSSSNRPIPVKLIGNLFDTCQVVMAILLDFLTNEVDDSNDKVGHVSDAIQKYATCLPPLLELHDSYKLDTASAWMLSRPLIRAASRADDKCDMLTSFRSTAGTRKFFETMLPAPTWSYLSTILFECFFANTVQDIFCPKDIYVSEISRLEKEAERLSQKMHAPLPASIQPGASSEKPDKEELERVRKVITSLSRDYEKQRTHVASIQSELASKTRDFFASSQVSPESATAFFVHCIYPRCMQGPDDAMFCAHFVAFLHQNETPGFSTLQFFNTLIITLSRSLYCLTEGEAACASILLYETWKVVSKWRYNEAAFEAELVGKPGSFMIVASEDGVKGPVAVTKNEYEHLYNKWHATMGATFIGCLQSSEYMHLRNCLVVLTRMVEEYPTRPKLANNLLQTLEPLQKESNSFADIRASAQAYIMQLLRSRDNGVWKEEDAATVQARLAKVEAAAAQRHKKAEEQMAEIKRDSEKITEEIGGRDSRDRSRVRGQAFGDKGANRGDRFEQEDRRVSGGGDDRRRPLLPGTADDHRSGIRPPPPPRDPTMHLQQSKVDPRSHDRGPAVGSYTSIAPESRRREDGRQQEESQSGTVRNLEGRWQHAGRTSPARGDVAIGGGNRKRSRPSSPVEQGETQDQPQPADTKRLKSSGDEGARGEDEDDDDGKRRHGNGRGGNRRRPGGARR